VVGTDGCVWADHIHFFSVTTVFKLGSGKETGTSGETHWFGGVWQSEAKDEGSATGAAGDTIEEWDVGPCWGELANSGRGQVADRWPFCECHGIVCELCHGGK